jgi:N-methylhydantoinase A/oxoprolinase/acetone carboxylase beta subunit
MDYSHRRHKSIASALTPDMDEATKLAYLAPVTAAWDDLEKELITELKEEGFEENQITTSRVVYMKFLGQLHDIEVESPVNSLETVADMDKLLSHFETVYTTMLTLAAKPDIQAYQLTEVCVIAKVDTVKPKLREFKLGSKEPAKEAFKGKRQVFQQGKWHDADIWEMEKLVPGNAIDGLAVVEASNTTLFVPPEWHVRIDEHDIYWLERKDG